MTETAQPDRRPAGDRGARSGMAGLELHSMHRTSRGTVTYASGTPAEPGWYCWTASRWRHPAGPCRRGRVTPPTTRGAGRTAGGEAASTSASPGASARRDVHPFDRDVDPFDRMLLTTDGTVTSQLEAATGEPIITRTTRQAGPATLDVLLAATGPWARRHRTPSSCATGAAHRSPCHPSRRSERHPVRPGGLVGRARSPARRECRAPEARRRLVGAPAGLSAGSRRAGRYCGSQPNAQARPAIISVPSRVPRSRVAPTGSWCVNEPPPW